MVTGTLIDNVDWSVRERGRLHSKWNSVQPNANNTAAQRKKVSAMSWPQVDDMPDV